MEGSVAGKEVEESIRRTRLAIERTRLSNEQTLLAYVRTALALAAGGAALLQFFPVRSDLHWIAWTLIAGGLVTLVAGGFRFLSVARSLRA